MRKHFFVLPLEASSPAELNTNLTEEIQRNGAHSKPAAVSLDEPKAMVCPFQVEAAAAKDLQHHLLSDAGEILSLTPDEIVLDYQITKSDPKTVAGLYLCMPKGLFEDYLKVLDRKYFNAVKVTERFLASVDWLYQQGKLSEKRVCFLDFSVQGTVSLFISGHGECELLRKIRYEDYEEARKEIIQSLRSASAKSSAKHYDHIYYHGGFDSFDGVQAPPFKAGTKDAAQSHPEPSPALKSGACRRGDEINSLAASLKEIFQADIEEVAAIDRKAALTGGKKYFKLNLIRKYNFSENQLKYIYAGVNIVVALCLMNLALTGLQMVKKNLEVSRVKDYYKAEEIQYALELKENLAK